MEDKKNILKDLIERARSSGADAVDAMYIVGQGVSVGVQNKKLESLERSEGHDLGLRIIMGGRQAVGSTTDFSSDGLKSLVEMTVNMARYVPKDPYCGLADADQLVQNIPDLDMYDATELSEQELIDKALACEDAALAMPGITTTEGAGASWSKSHGVILASNGFEGCFQNSGFYVGVAPVAGETPNMQVDWDSDDAVFLCDMDEAHLVGERAARRAIRRLNPKKAETGKIPVIFEPRVASELLGMFASAINGQSIARKTSFLAGDLNKQVFKDNITIIDDPLMKRGKRSRSFDAEGLPAVKREIVKNGCLLTWVLDLASGRQLNMSSTGNASRGPGSIPRPSISNLYMMPGKQSPENLIKSLDKAFFVTETMGNGVNGITGDLSLGASGLWIEKGEIVFPVSEMTVAGNLKDMFGNITPCSDLEHRYGIDTPTLLVEDVMVAGK